MVTDLNSNQQIAWLKEVMRTQLITTSHFLLKQKEIKSADCTAQGSDTYLTQFVTISHALDGHRLAFRSADCLAKGCVLNLSL